MNLLILTQYPAPYRVALFNLLAKEHNVTVFFEKENIDRNPLYLSKDGELRKYNLYEENGKKEYKKALSSLEKFDCVLLFEFSTVTAGKLIFKCISRKIPYVINCDGAFLRTRSFLKTWVKRKFIRNAVFSIAGGESAVQYLKSYGAEPEKIVRYGLSSIHKNEVLTANDIEEKFAGKAENGETITLSVGRMVSGKRFELLLNIWKNMDKRHKLYIIGGGPEYERLKDRVQAMDLSNVLVFDFMKREELFKYYREADLFAFVSESEAWGLVINEALAHGIPVVSGNHCVAALELVKNAYNGYIIEERDLEDMLSEMQSKIQTVLETPNLRKTYALNSVASVEGYTYEHMSEILLKSLKEIK